MIEHILGHNIHLIVVFLESDASPVSVQTPDSKVLWWGLGTEFPKGQLLAHRQRPVCVSRATEEGGVVCALLKCTQRRGQVGAEFQPAFVPWDHGAVSSQKILFSSHKGTVSASSGPVFWGKLANPRIPGGVTCAVTG